MRPTQHHKCTHTCVFLPAASHLGSGSGRRFHAKLTITLDLIHRSVANPLSCHPTQPAKTSMYNFTFEIFHFSLENEAAMDALGEGAAFLGEAATVLGNGVTVLGEGATVLGDGMWTALDLAITGLGTAAECFAEFPAWFAQYCSENVDLGEMGSVVASFAEAAHAFVTAGVAALQSAPTDAMNTVISQIASLAGVINAALGLVAIALQPLTDATVDVFDRLLLPTVVDFITIEVPYILQASARALASTRCAFVMMREGRCIE